VLNDAADKAAKAATAAFEERPEPSASETAKPEN